MTIYLKEAILNGTKGSCNFLEKLFIKDYFPYQHLQDNETKESHRNCNHFVSLGALFIQAKIPATSVWSDRNIRNQL